MVRKLAEEGADDADADDDEEGTGRGLHSSTST
jgi:hypothetical protein